MALARFEPAMAVITRPLDVGGALNTRREPPARKSGAIAIRDAALTRF